MIMAYDQYHQLMNDTKWKEIRLAMNDYPNNRQWRTKDNENGTFALGMENGFIILGIGVISLFNG
jgi:hypothetical protein